MRLCLDLVSCVRGTMEAYSWSVGITMLPLKSTTTSAATTPATFCEF